MASAWYNKGKYQVLSGGVDLNSDTIKVILVTTSYTFDVDHNFISDVSSNELSVSGYTGGFSGSGRKTLSGKSFTEDDSSNLAYFDATDLVWSALGTGATIGGAILVKEVTNDGDSPLIAYMDLTDTATNGGDITVSWNASGLLRAL
jgi:hypothetical protein